MILAAACGGHALVDTPRPPTSDEALEARLIEVSGGRGLALFAQPASEDFENIPQEAKNPITREKVDLGRLLFHETALGTKPELEIGEGGSGFGHAGQGRAVSAAYPAERIDVQLIRTPSALNVACQENMTWSGQLGATGANEGTKYAWMGARAFNRLGYEGVETQAMAALQTHRLDVGRLVSPHEP